MSNKRGGFIAYLIYILVLVLAIVSFFGSMSQNQPAEDLSTSEQLSQAFLVVLSVYLFIFLGIPAGVLFILKTLNLITGWKLFGVLCLLIDIAVAGLLLITLVSSLSTGGVSLSSVLSYIGIIAIPVVAFLSELKGLRQD